MAELADAHDSGSCGATRAGSIPVFGSFCRYIIEFIMPTKPIRRKPYNVGIKPIDRTIQRLVAMTGDVRNQDLLLQIATTVAKIGREEFSRGDLKLLNTTLKELRWSFRVFKPYRHIRKVTIFGSARTPETASTYKSAIQFGKLMTEAGWMTITGASTGIMKAGHEGAGREKSFGVNILLPFEQDVNAVIHRDPKLIHFKYFFTRKLIFIKESDATVLYPGGFGTQDEGFESLTLVQTGKNNPRPIVLVDTKTGAYWQDWLRYIKKEFADQKMINREDLKLVDFVRSPEKARDVVLKFYKVYHSIRYVNGQTVIRLNQDITDSTLKGINREFKALLASGKIERSAPLSQESDEPDLKDKPRLVMNFDRRHYGLLKLMIDAVNEDA